MKDLIARIKSFRLNKEAATAIEYALIASLIALIIIIAVTSIGTTLNTTFSKVGSSLTG